MESFVIDKKGSPKNAQKRDDFDETGKGFRIFVRGLPFDLTTSQLETHFEGIGPLKTCFIVTERETRKSRGFGFVGFAFKEDAQEAIKQFDGKKLLGKKLLIEMAAEKGKKPEKKKRMQKKERKGQNEEEGTEKPKGKKRKRSEKDGDDEKKIKKRKNKAAVKSSSVLMVSGFKPNLPAKAVRRILKKFGPVHFILFPSPESQEDNLVAKVWYKHEGNAKGAFKKIMNGYQNLHAKFLADSEKHFRLILRNLSFKCLQKTLEKECRKHGELIEVNMPKRDDGGQKGFAFIQYKNPKDAKKALVAMNGTRICNRQVAVDWCLGRDTFQHLTRMAERKENQKNEKKEAKENEENSETNKPSENDEQKEEKSVSDNEKKDVENFLDDDDSDSDSENNEDKKDNSEEKNENKNNLDSTDSEIKSEGGDKIEEKEVGEEKMEEEEDEEEKETKTPTKAPRNKVKSGDVAERCTLFIRNLPFTVKEYQLKKKFIQFGEIEYAKIVMDKKLDRPKGTAFIKFKRRGDATKVLKKYGLKNQQNTKYRKREVSIAKGGLSLDGRPLLISLAITKNSVKGLEKKFKEDKRNIYLLKEGYIDENSPEAQNFSKVELERRQSSFKQRVDKLENANFSVSRVRLSVQNLPPSMEEKQLKSLFHSTAVKLRKALKYSCRQNMPKISQVKIVRDKIRKNKDGKLKSKCFGFIQFREHQDALAVLRKLNNSEATGKKRLQVEFAIENERVVHVRSERLKKHQKITKENLNTKKNRKDVEGDDKKIKRKQKGKKRKFQEQSIGRMKKGKNDLPDQPKKKGKMKKVKNVKRPELKAKKKKFHFSKNRNQKNAARKGKKP